jgi:hypothetical protein
MENKKFNSIAQIENEVFLMVENAINKTYESYDLKDFTERIKKDFINKMINKYNVFNLERHALSDTNNYNKDNISFSKLVYDKEFNFIDIEDKIKSVFSNYNKEDRIKEIAPYLDIEKVFNKDKKKYFSLYDFAKTTTEKEISDTIINLDKFCLNFSYGCFNFPYAYQIIERLNKFKEYLKLEFNIDINVLDTQRDSKKQDLKIYENGVNESKEIKVKFFNDFMYLSFTDTAQQNKFKEILINQTNKRLLQTRS